MRGFIDGSTPRTLHTGAYMQKNEGAEPACNTTFCYINVGQPPAVAGITHPSSDQRSSLSETRELSGKGRVHTTDSDRFL